MTIQVAVDNDRPVRIGVNWGSLDKRLLSELMDENARLRVPLGAREVMLNAMVESTVRSAELSEELGLPHDHIVLSAKMSQVGDLVDVYRMLASRTDYPLHVGQIIKNRQCKSRCFTGSGLRTANHVAPFEQRRYGLFLNR